jgi:hypothetical protein
VVPVGPRGEAPLDRDLQERRAPPYNTGMKKFARDMGMVLFTIFGIPLIIATPFLLYGFLGKP